MIYLKKNSNYPKSIIIFRQGVSQQLIDHLKIEICQICQFCKNKNIGYYYILVNKKTNFKFLEINGNNYKNPGTGLLIMGGITNKNYFEFYTQPQEITGGIGKPICFHAAFGNMNYPELLPKFTFELYNIYRLERKN